MKKIWKLISVAFLAAGVIPVDKEIKLNAADNYAMGCSAYEVDTINYDGSFNLVQCTDSFENARNIMNSEGDNAIVRHGASLSPSKIIAMSTNGGTAYSYPGRDNRGLDYIYDTDTRASTYMPTGREMYYMNTLSYNGDGTGTVEVEVRGFHGTTELKDLDLVPNLFAANDLKLTLGGNSYSGEEPFTYTMNSSYYEIEQNGNYKDLVLYAYNNKNQFVFQYAVGPAADWMQIGTTYYSSDDVNFYYDSYHRNKAGTYYNYYQFAPLRTKSSIPEDKYNAFLTYQGFNSSSKLWNSGTYFLQDQEQYGMNAAMVFAQAACESAYGTSNFAVNRNNLFGVNAVDSNPNQADSFASVKTGIDLQMRYLLRDYLDDDDWRCFGPSFGNKGTGITVKYASSIYYGATLARIYYAFDKFANNYDGNLTDIYANSIGVVTNNNASTYTSSAADKESQHNYQNTTGYMKNVTVSILGEEGDYYKVQSQFYLNSDGTKMTLNGTDAPKWDWNTMVSYIRKSDVSVITSNYTPSSDNYAVVYRSYNPYNGEHLFTTSRNEYDRLGRIGWINEGEAWKSPKTGNTPVYRLYNPYDGTHLYTADKSEYDRLTSIGWTGEDISFYSASSDGTGIYRMYNSYSGQHLFTSDAQEYVRNEEAGWIGENIIFYGA